MQVNVDIRNYPTLCKLVIKWGIYMRRKGCGKNDTVAKTQDSSNQCYLEKAKPSYKENLYV